MDFAHDHPKMSFETLRSIRFEGELLPEWAQLLDLAAALSEVPQPTRKWFAQFTRRTGADDVRTVIEHAEKLRTAIQQKKQLIASELLRKVNDPQPDRILAAWFYSLDTIIQSATGKETCSWHVEGAHDPDETDFGGGEIGLRRI